MYFKYPKSEFVRTLLRHKSETRLNGRISFILLSWIKELNPEIPIMKTIRRYIVEGLYRDGLRMYDQGIGKQFRIEAKHPYMKGRCKKCWFVKNW